MTCFANLISIAAPVNAQILNEPVDLKLAPEDGATREVWEPFAVRFIKLEPHGCQRINGAAKIAANI